jgi:hypothetical protein
MTDRIWLSLTDLERKLIRERCQLPGDLRDRFSDKYVERPTISLSRAEADEVREAVADQLQRVGFNEQWGVTAEGRALEGIIDKLQSPKS